MNLEQFLLRASRGAASRVRIFCYGLLGLKIGHHNRMEGGGRCRRLSQIQIGNYNAFSQGSWLWPVDEHFDAIRIKIGNGNYFNRNLMIDACRSVEIGDGNMFGPDVYIADSNHTFEEGISPKQLPMERGTVKIGNNCWIGAKVVILKDVQLGDECVVGAGAVVTKSFGNGSVIAGVPARLLSQREAG